MTSTHTSANAPVRTALDGIHATVTHEDRDGFDFTVDGIHGVARSRGGRFRASYLLILDPDRTEAADFAESHGGLPDGDVQLIESPEGSFLRLLVECPFEDHGRIWTSAQTARALHAAWLNRHERGGDLTDTLASAGIAVPPLGPAQDAPFYTYGAWSWGTRYLPPFVLYMFEAELVMRRLLDFGPMFALAHAGHGINSYGLNLVTTGGPVAAYVQHGYGGAYANPVRDLIEINATYSRLHVLLGATQEMDAGELRWLLVYSRFRDVCGIVDLDKIRAGHSTGDAFGPVESEANLFETTAARLNLRSGDFGTAGGVSW